LFQKVTPLEETVHQDDSVLDVTGLGYYAMPISDHAAARSSFSAPRATIFNASSGKRSLQRLRFVPRRAHPNVVLFIRRQDRRHRLGMARFDGGGWRPHEDARHSKKGPRVHRGLSFIRVL
jgi:hypothetical protein